MAEGLSSAVRETKRKGLLEGLKIRRKDVGVSMLQFAYDTTIICKSNTKNIITIKSILRCL